MNYDRQIKISTANSRKAANWRTETLWWSELAERLRTPARSTETLAEYLRYPKARQDDLKDVGGYVGGELIGGHRKAGAVASRDLIALDIDNIPAGALEDIERRIKALGCGSIDYSTRKHERAKPRLRILPNINRTMTADEYEPVARKIAWYIDPTMAMFDPSTFEPSRLMYWPSCCADSEYFFLNIDAPPIDVDAVLREYADWHDMSQWPQVPGVGQQRVKQAIAKQSDPTTKSGVVGAFCRVYDVYKVMDTFLPGRYLPVDDGERYTYTGGSTTGGAVVYENGAFLYSHHATDPAGGKLCNAFDLVRYHLFADKDDDAKPDTPVNKLPSYSAMCELAIADKSVAGLLQSERYERAVQAFDTPAVAAADASWMSKLKISPTTGQPAKDPENVRLVLSCDPLLKDRIRLDVFTDTIIGTAPLPWGSRKDETGDFKWTNRDFDGLRGHMNRILGFAAKDTIEFTFNDFLGEHSFNPVVDYLSALTWDGQPRLDTLFIDYIGAVDNQYTRAVTRKMFTAAVARALSPGIKFDTMLVLTGPGGVGKSRTLRHMGGAWFNDSVSSFEGKEPCELIQGAWIVELGELTGFKKADVGRIKQFLSQQEDVYRPAYGRTVEWRPRHCVFFGTSNDAEYLRDKTGNRRYWPLDVYVTVPAKNIESELDGERNQLWAEAVVRWKAGEQLYLSGDLIKYAEAEQINHSERSPREGLILDFIERKVPDDWYKWPLDSRRTFWSGGMKVEDLHLVERTRICAMEVWCEQLGGDFKGMKYADAVEINNTIATAPGWGREKSSSRYGYCGITRGCERM
jgi:Predicted P-loop ATPase and inactivated derivatives